MCGKSDATIENCKITDNTGSGIYWGGATASPKIQGNSFDGNGKNAMRFMPTVDISNVTGNGGTGSVEISGGTITRNTLWPANIGLPFAVSGDITINNSAGTCTLTVAKGARVGFTNSRLYVYDVLQAEGTLSDSIYFTTSSSTPSPGQWVGIYFEGTGSGILDYCTVEYGGYNSDPPTNIHLSSGTTPIIRNSTIRKANHQIPTAYPSYGIYGMNSDATIENCQISDNTGSGIYWSGATGSPKIQGNRFSGNGKNAMSFMPTVDISNVTGNGGTGSVEISGGTITRNTLWPANIGLPFVVSGDVTINNTSGTCTLTVAKGARVGFTNSRLYVYDVLQAEGTLSDSIYFTTSSSTPSPGQWVGIYFEGTGSGILDYCTVEYGGYNSDPPTNIHLSSGTNPIIRNSTIRKAGHQQLDAYLSYGIYSVNSNATIENCKITDNTGSGIYWGGATASPKIQGNSFDGNGKNAMRFMPTVDISNVTGNGGTGSVEISGGTITRNTLWPANIGLPFAVSGDITINNSAGTCTLTVAKGARVGFTNSRLYVYDVLQAEGTLSDSIYFTTSSSTPSPGQWVGIYFEGTGSGILDYCTVEYGGYNSDPPTNIHLSSGTTPIIRNSTIRKANHQIPTAYPSYGIYGMNSDATIENCQISDNTGSGIYWSGATGSPKIQGNRFSGNGKNAMSFMPTVDISNVTGNGGTGSVEISGGTITRNTLWPANIGLPFVVSGDVTINNTSGTCTLTVAKGARVGFTNSRLYVYDVLRAQGTITDSIAFTTSSSTPASGQWVGIYFEGTGSGILDYCVVEYGGYNSDPPTNIHLASGTTLTMQNSTIRKAGHQTPNIYPSHGIYCAGGNLLLLTSLVTQNSIGVTNTAAATSMYLRNNRITGNTLYGINNTSGGSAFSVDARNNYWGDPSGPLDPSDDRAAGGLYNPAGKGDKVSDGVMYSPWNWLVDSQSMQLNAGAPFNDTLTTGSISYFTFHPQPGRSYLVELTPDSCLTSLLFSREYGTEISETKTPRGNYELYVPASNDTVHHFSILARQTCPSGGSYRITIRYIDDVYVSDISPRTAGNGGKITIEIRGLNLSTALPVRLSHSGLPSYNAIAMSGSSSERIHATFDLTGAQAGVYDVTVGTANPNSTLSSAFEILGQATPGHLRVSIGGPGAVRRGGTYTYYVEYENDGSADEPAPLLSIEPTDANVRLSKSNPFSSKSFQFLAVSGAGSAGTLTPGAKNVIPFQTNVLSSASGGISLTAKKMIADATLMEWDSIETSIRPDTSSMGRDAWNAIWSNFKSQVGATTKNYLSALNTNATFIRDNRHRTDKILIGSTMLDLPATDQTVYDVNSLLEFEFARASGKHNPRTVLASADDVFIPAPGMPLTFQRIAPQPIPNRFRLGELGRGWYHSHEISMTKETDGRVLISRPGDAFARIFQPTGGGAYFGLPGDFANLTFSSDTAVLREKEGTTTRFLPDGKISSIRDPNKNGLSFVYAGGLLQQIDHTNGQSLVFEHNGDGRISRITGPGGIDIQYDYDGAGEHLAKVTEPGSVITRYSYNGANGTPSAHAMTAITNPDGSEYEYDYDTKGRLTEEANRDGSGRIRYQYPGAGTVRMIDNDDKVTLMNFGTRGEILSIRDPNGNDYGLAFDGKDMVSEINRPDGLGSQVSYDGSGNPTGYTDPNNQIVRTSFSPKFSLLSKIIDARSNPLSYGYDTLANLDSITYADGKSEKFAHDSTGSIKKFTNRRGQEVPFRVNTRGQVTSKTYPDGRTFTYTYDTLGNMLTAVDSKTGTVAMQYDARKFLTRIEYPGGYWFAFEYNNAGNRTKRTDQLGNVLDYEYDVSGRLTRLVEGGTFEVVRYEYDANGRLAREFKGNGTKTTYAYDAAGQILSMQNLAPDNTVQLRFDYTYDVNGNRKTMSTLDGIHRYTYDDIGQLTKAEYPDGKYESFEYDAAGNRIKVVENSVTTAYTTNNLNQYTSVGSDVYTYDADGNMKTKTDASGTTTFDWDAESRLVKVTAGDGRVWEYTYDALGNRVLVSDNGVEKRVVFDPRGLVDVVAEYNGSGKLLKRYEHGLGLVSVQDSGKAAFFAFDALGSTRQIVDSVGVEVEEYGYKAFGEDTANADYENQFRYVGRFGVCSGGRNLLFMRARYYALSTGRFVSLDPIDILGGLNLYRYVDNSPTCLTDPAGLGGTGSSVVTRTAGTILEGEYLLYEGLGAVRKRIKDIEDAEKECFGPITNYPRNNSPVADIHPGIIRPSDPNEKIAPPGIGPEHYVPQGSELSYTIYFENKPTATAPAQEVFVHDNLSSNLDWSTFKFGEIAFGDKSIDCIAGKQSGKYMVLHSDTEAVDIDAKFNPSSGNISWTLRTLDTRTGELPEDALAGFLPPEDGTGRGQGHVTFTVKAKSNLVSGTQIKNTATIIFDTETPITTAEVFNTVTDSAPASPTTPTPVDGATGLSLTSMLNWSDCKYATAYDVYLWPSGDSKPATPTSSNLQSTYFDATTKIVKGVTYNWQVIAKNVMGTTPGPVWQFATDIAAPIISTQPTDQSAIEGQTATFTVVATGVGISYQWQWDSGDIAGATSASYTTPALAMSDSGAVFCCVVSNAGGSVTSNSAILTVSLSTGIETIKRSDIVTAQPSRSLAATKNNGNDSPNISRPAAINNNQVRNNTATAIKTRNLMLEPISAATVDTIKLADGATIPKPQTTSSISKRADTNIISSPSTDTNIAKVSITQTTAALNRFDFSWQPADSLNADSKLVYTLPTGSMVKFKLYNKKGKVLRKISEKKTAGTYTISFNSGELAKGYYTYNLETDDFAVKSHFNIKK